MLRANLYSQKFIKKPLKPIYIISEKIRIGAINIMERYNQDYEDDYHAYTNNIESGLKHDFLENYYWENLPEINFDDGIKREATIKEFLRYDFLSTKTQFLDAIQIYIDHSTNQKIYVNEINNLFEINSFGYRIINNEIIKIGTDEQYKNLNITIDLLNKIDLRNAKEEIIEAFKYFYNGDNATAIKKSFDAVNTVLKYIILNDDEIRDKNIEDQQGNTKDLLSRIVECGYFNNIGNVKIHLGIEHILCPLRNKTPGAGHSKGLNKYEIDEETVLFSLSLASSYINFLISKNLKKS